MQALLSHLRTIGANCQFLNRKATRTVASSVSLSGRVTFGIPILRNTRAYKARLPPQTAHGLRKLRACKARLPRPTAPARKARLPPQTVSTCKARLPPRTARGLRNTRAYKARLPPRTVSTCKARLPRPTAPARKARLSGIVAVRRAALSKVGVCKRWITERIEHGTSRMSSKICGESMTGIAVI